MATSVNPGPPSRGSDDIHSLICLPCHRVRITEPANGYCIDCKEHLCLSCYKYHKKAAPCRHHTLLDEDAMPLTRRHANTGTNTTVHTGTKEIMTSQCPCHKNERIKLYCNDHGLLLCSVCVALEHNKPCHVDYIPDISDKMINSQEYKYTMDRLNKLRKECTAIKTDTSNDVNKSKNSLKNALQEVKKYKQEINKRIDELQKEIETEIQVLQQQHDEQIKSVDMICEDVMKMVEVTSDNIKQLNISKQANQLFMKVKLAQKQLHDYEQSISSLSTQDSTDEYMFMPSQTINDILQKEKMIGYLTTKNKTRPGSALQFRQGEINVRTSSDSRNCCIVGLTVLPPNRLVLADAYNNSIKLVDVNSKSISSQLSLGTEIADQPCDITSTTSTQVAVTILNRKQIQFISVSGKLISKSHTIHIDGDCNGICSYLNKLVVTCCNPGKLEVLDTKGTVSACVKTDSTGKEIFQKPRYVQANSKSIYVSDIGLNEVIQLNWNGEVTGKITDVDVPWGLALFGDGRLFVCDAGSGKVCQVLGCPSRRVVMQDVSSPVTVCVDYRGHRLYIGRWTDDDKMSNNILVYSLYPSKVETRDV